MSGASPSGVTASAVRAAALTRLITVLLGVLAALLFSATPAAAHPFLLFTTPAVDTAAAGSPSSVQLVFSEAVSVASDAVSVTGPAGPAGAVGVAAGARQGRVVTAPLRESLAAGGYTVRWRVTGQDGDVVEGEFGFAVGAAVPGAAGNTTGTGPSPAVAALRTVLFAGLAVALGGLVARRVEAVPLAENPTLRSPRPWTGFGALAGLGAAAGLLAVLVAETGLVPWRELPGQLLLVEAVGFAAAALPVRRGRHRWATAALTVVIAAEGVRSHAGIAAPGWGALLTAVHLAAAAGWAGALLQTVRVALAWREHRAAVRWVLTGYARTAAWLVLAVVATGTATAVLLVPAGTLTTTTYGLLLLGKIALVAAATVTAAAARWALSRHDGLLGRVPRWARVETVILAAVLASAAALVSTPIAGGAAPPPATGPVSPTGTLAGQIGVSVEASQGRVVVRLATPRRGDYYGPAQPQTYQLTGSLRPAGGPPRELGFQPCGQGCFLATVTWETGGNPLALQVRADNWRGADVDLTVPWPVTPAADLLASTVTTMRGLGAFTLDEAVTSDSTAPRAPTALPLTGPEFLTEQPYGSGVAPIAARSERDGRTVLSLAFPAEGVTDQLVLDPQGRIAEETLTDATHLIQRRFHYPTPS